MIPHVNALLGWQCRWVVEHPSRGYVDDCLGEFSLQLAHKCRLHPSSVKRNQSLFKTDYAKWDRLSPRVLPRTTPRNLGRLLVAPEDGNLSIVTMKHPMGSVLL
jgi:hypothetical protein